MTYSIRDEGRIYTAERLLYVAPKGSVPIGFAPTRTERIAVTIKGKGAADSNQKEVRP